MNLSINQSMTISQALFLQIQIFLYVFVEKPLPGKFPTETQWNNQPPEKITWNSWGYKVQDGNHQSWEGDGPYWIGAGARLANCTFGEKKRVRCSEIWFPWIGFFKWFLHIKNVKRYVMIYILMDERELRRTKKEERQIHWKIPTEMATQGQQRRWESRLRNVTWFPVERWLDLPLCEGFQYVVTLREPVPRVLHQHLEGKECMWHHVTPFFFFWDACELGEYWWLATLPF